MLKFTATIRAVSEKQIGEFLVEAAEAFEHGSDDRKLPLKWGHVFARSYAEYKLEREGQTTPAQVLKAIGLLIVGYFALVGFVHTFR